MCACCEGREVTTGKLVLQGGSEEMEPRSLQACRACCTLMSPADWAAILEEATRASCSLDLLLNAFLEQADTNLQLESGDVQGSWSLKYQVV